jgi:1-aminocyclopropane-1-carboxylate deaminase
VTNQFRLAPSFPGISPVSLGTSFEHQKELKIQIIRDDKLPLGLGSKWRRFYGFSKKVRSKKVLLKGSLHGNFLSSFTYLFSSEGKSVNCYTYARDPHQSIGFNARLVLSNSNVQIFESPREMHSEFTKSVSIDPESFFLPEFGFHWIGILGYLKLWRELELQGPPSLLFVEIGSGLGFLSALLYFKDTNWKVYGISHGRQRIRWLKELQEGWTPFWDGFADPKPRTEFGKRLAVCFTMDWSDQNQDFHSDFARILSNYTLLGSDSPDWDYIYSRTVNSSEKYIPIGKRPKRNNNQIVSFYQQTGILLEPMYSIPSFQMFGSNEFRNWLDHCLRDLGHPKTNEIYYLHQGGVLNFWDQFGKEIFPF